MNEFIIDMGNSSYKSSSGLLCADVSQLREKIVRCRDCKYSDKGYWCRYFGKYGDLPTVTPDGFCAWSIMK